MSKRKNYPLVSESLAENDLKWLVSEIAFIDMHKTKLGDDKDYIVLAIAINDHSPAHDLATFIENSPFDFEDVEVSPATDSKGRYLVYVELRRDGQAFNTINKILKDSEKLTGIESWKFKTMGNGAEQDLTPENFAASIVTDPAEYERLHPKQEEEQTPAPEPEMAAETEPTTESIKKRLNFLLKY